MNHPLQQVTIQLVLSEYGDALFFGADERAEYIPGLALKHLLFAWHEASVYGTELAVRRIDDVEVVVLPAEQTLAFFAGLRPLRHIGWSFVNNAERLLLLAPLLDELIDARRYAPSLAAFREGALRWHWDAKAPELAAAGSETRAALRGLADVPDFAAGLRAAFSAAVMQRHYGTAAALNDLRGEFPPLASPGGAGTAGMDEDSWLMSIGWRADTAAFRTALQLLEPDEEHPVWRLQLLLQDKRDASALVPVRLADDGEPHGLWPASWTTHVRERGPGWLSQLRESLPAHIGHGADVFAQPLGDEGAWRFLTEDSRRLLAAGWQVLLPAWWEAAGRTKPRLRAKVRAGEEARSGKSLFGMDSIIDFDWRVSIGEADLSEEEFAELLARGQRLVNFRGQWIPLDPALLAQIQRAMAGMDKSRGLSFQDALQLHILREQRKAFVQKAGAEAPEEEEEDPLEAAARLELEVELNEQLLGLVRQLGRGAERPAPEPPAGLRAELRSYQREGFGWLAFLRRYGMGAVLADDMGLGKTVQLIAYLLHVKELEAQSLREDAPAGRRQTDPPGWPALIICPTSVLGNWQKELQRFAPSLKVMLHYGSRRLADGFFFGAAMQADVVLTSYATASLDQELLKQFTWNAICLDEAQNIKNAGTKQSAAVRSFPALHKIALTGTPIENRLSELWSIYDFITPGYLGSAKAFQTRFALPIEKERSEERTAELQKLVQPFMLRRKKKDPDIQLDLPDKNEMKTYIHLTAEQAALYEQTVAELMEKMKQLEGMQRKGAILSALTSLKQLCDHPLLLTKEGNPDLEPGDIPALIERSAKLERLLAMVRELREENDRCLIFTQYIGMGNMLKRVLEAELGEPVLYLNGSTPKTVRDRMIERFQAPAASASSTGEAGDQPNVFILSLKAGGVGLNLTAANHVFHFDRWWNPAVENQATDRAYRMGQTKDVQVHKFISLGTLEERIDEMLVGKQQLSDDVISSSEQWITELSTEALRELITLRRDWSG